MSSEPRPAQSSTSPTKPSHSSRQSTSKRLSSAPALSRPVAVNIHPTALISTHAALTGSHAITISEGAIIHPYAQIDASSCAVTVGPGAILWEKAFVGLKSESSGDKGEKQESVTLGRNVVLESGAVVQAAHVGDGTIIEVEAKLEQGSIVGKLCKIGARVTVPQSLPIPDCTIYYGANDRRIDKTLKSHSKVGELRARGHEKQLETLRRLLVSNTAKWTS